MGVFSKRLRLSTCRISWSDASSEYGRLFPGNLVAVIFEGHPSFDTIKGVGESDARLPHGRGPAAQGQCYVGVGGCVEGAMKRQRPRVRWGESTPEALPVK